MSTEVDQDVPIILNGQNIELTPALIDHVNKRIGGPLKKLASNGALTECDVVLSVNKNPKVRRLAALDLIGSCYQSFRASELWAHNPSRFTTRSRIATELKLSPT